MRDKNQQNEKRESKKLNIKETGEKSILFSLVIYTVFILILLILPSIAQENSIVSSDQEQEQPTKTQLHFYNVDREITVEGQVQDLKFESRYENRGHFLILTVKEKTSGEPMEVETAPAWFFKIDIHRGENVRLIGSLTGDEKQSKKMIIAREIKIANKTIILRDRRGFPAWGRGQGRKRGSP
jgi:competence protein ComGC